MANQPLLYVIGHKRYRVQRNKVKVIQVHRFWYQSKAYLRLPSY